MRNKSYLVIAAVFVAIVIANKSGQLSKRIDEYQKQEQIQIDRIEELKIENQKIQGELEAEKLRADKRVSNRLARESKPKKVAVAPSLAGVEQWRPLCEKHFGGQASNCLLVMKYESGGNPNSVSPTDDHGLMQINGKTWVSFFGVTREQLKDPETNIRLAKVIYDRSGSWYPWTAARKLGLT